MHIQFKNKCAAPTSMHRMHVKHTDNGNNKTQQLKTM